MTEVSIVKMDVTPKCPYCEKDLDQIGKVNTGFLSVTKILICPHCKKVLGTIYKA